MNLKEKYKYVITTKSTEYYRMLIIWLISISYN